MSTQSDQPDRIPELVAELDQAGDLTAAGAELPPPAPPTYVVRIDIDDTGHAEIDARRPRAYVIAALRHIADHLEAQG